MLIAFLFDAAGRYFRYRSQLASIIELDDRTLSDIGLSRSELRSRLDCGRAVGHGTKSPCTPALAKGPRERGPRCWLRPADQCLISGGSLPPFAASFAITCLCSQIFMLAESLLSPV